MSNLRTTLAQLLTAAEAEDFSDQTIANICTWLTQPYLAEYAPAVVAHLAAGRWRELKEAFWKELEFGTGGRRGRLYPIGCNAVNDRTIGESAQGLADYVRQKYPRQRLACAIAYDTRHRSREFAQLCAEIMAAAGFTVYFLDGYRSTPELSFAVRYKRCHCGIIITASHNPPTDNAIKVYGSSGGQYVPPDDEAATARMRRVTWIERMPFAEAVAAGRVKYCQREVDRAFVKAVLGNAVPGPRELKILYSPLHGVGTTAVCPVLEADGFAAVEVFGPHADPDPDFSHVPDRMANPENRAVFTAIIEHARRIGAELILATDPDADRIGCAAPFSLVPDAPWETITGNQAGALLTDFLLGVRRAAGTLTPQHYVVKTLVTTELIRRIAEDYGVQTVGNLLVGFRWIAAEIDRRGPELFLLGAEESYGLLAGAHVRDKDGAVAAMLLAELAARLKQQGRTLHDKLDELFLRHGCHSEGQLNLKMPGEEGMADMRRLMTRLREDPPRVLGGLKIAAVHDYWRREVRRWDGSSQPIEGVPQADMLFFELESVGNRVAVRPSGTEPKVKFYTFAYDPPQHNLAAVKAKQQALLQQLEADLRAIAAETLSAR